MKLRENCKYAMIVPSSMGVRLCPENGQPVYSSDTFKMQATSAETNVASISAYLGLPVKVLTTFVAESPIAAFIKQNLPFAVSIMRAGKFRRGARGAIAISSTSPIRATARADRESQTTAQARSDAR